MGSSNPEGFSEREPQRGKTKNLKIRVIPAIRATIKDRRYEQMQIKPLDDRIVVKPLEAEERTAGGIVLPDTAKEKPQRGKVIAVGPGRVLESGERAKPGVKKGDEVIYGKYAGTEIELGAKTYIILRESDVLAKVE